MWRLLFLMACFTKLTDATSTSKYGLVVDVGSSGSRVRVYTWSDLTNAIPTDITEIYNYKVEPGFSSLAENQDDIEGYITELLDAAKENVPEDVQSETPLFFMATAGMRLLPEETSNEMMNAADELFRDSSANPFLYESHNARLLSGEEEGAFAWIATNYLRGYFSGEADESVGIVEMGGASAQIAFVPESDVLDSLFPVTLAGVDYPLYAHSYLDYGQDMAIEWVEEYIWKASGRPKSLGNPCMLKGDHETLEIEGVTITMNGTGDPDSCLDAMNAFVYKVGEPYCHPTPCAIGPFYQPHVPDSMTFYSLGAFLYTLQDLDQMFDEPILQEDTLEPAGILKASARFCQENYDDAMALSSESPEYAKDVCFHGLYFGTLLTNGYGFDTDIARIRASDSVNGQDIEWPLGALLYETAR